MIGLVLLGVLCISGAATLMHLGWDYWDAHAAAIAVLACVSLVWFHLRQPGGSMVTLARILVLDLPPLIVTAKFLALGAGVPHPLNVIGFELVALALLLAGILTRYVWERHPFGHRRLRVVATVWLLPLAFYPLWRVVTDGHFWEPAALMSVAIVFIGFAFRTGWNAASPARSAEA